MPASGRLAAGAGVPVVVTPGRARVHHPISRGAWDERLERQVRVEVFSRTFKFLELATVTVTVTVGEFESL